MFRLDRVVPWGRSFEEYRRMFALGDDELRLRILGCADGPASFNAELTQAGGRVVSCDPLYCAEADGIRRRIDETCDAVLEETRRNRDEFVWTRHPRSVAELGQLRMAAMNRFLEDYPAGRRQGRYIDAELPELPFADNAFDLALASHFLFLYSEMLSADFHVRSIVEMCRVAGRCRVFPLLELGSRPSRHLGEVMHRLEQLGMTAAVERVDYEFQRGGNEMLRVAAPGVRPAAG